MSKLITKLIPKSVNLNGCGADSSSSLSGSDVAAALNVLEPIQQALIDCYYLRNDTYRQFLIEQAANELASHKVNHHMIDKMAPILIDDFLDNVCKSCNGTGFNRLSKDCGSCKGSGKKGYTYEKLSSLLGVSNGTLSRRYIQKYRDVIHRFEFLCMEAEKSIRNKIG